MVVNFHKSRFKQLNTLRYVTHKSEIISQKKILVNGVKYQRKEEKRLKNNLMSPELNSQVKRLLLHVNKNSYLGLSVNSAKSNKLSICTSIFG